MQAVTGHWGSRGGLGTATPGAGGSWDRGEERQRGCKAGGGALLSPCWAPESSGRQGSCLGAQAAACSFRPQILLPGTEL